jgi:hypothetical protein
VEIRTQKENPADLASRGTSITELAGNPQWWHIPDFLENRNYGQKTKWKYMMWPK